MQSTINIGQGQEIVASAIEDTAASTSQNTAASSRLLAASKSSFNGQNPILGGIDGRKKAATTAPPSRRILPKITEASTGSESDSACSLVVPPVVETAVTKAVAREDAGTSDSDDSVTDLTIDDIFQVLDSVCCVAFCKHACVPTDISVLLSYRMTVGERQRMLQMQTSRLNC